MNGPRRFWRGAIALALALIAFFLFGLTQWGPGAGMVSGQTVPRTPPPTFTATPSVTPAQQPTETLRPTATATLRPGEPTPIPLPNLELGIDASPLVVGPGQLVTVQLRVPNVGNGMGTGVSLDVSVPAPLSIGSINSDRGEYSLEAHRALLELDELAAEESWDVTLEAMVAADAWPGLTIPIDAALLYSEGSADAQVTIHLPPALLPAAGG